MRIDDSDTFRNTSGATESIIGTLQYFGLSWDGAISYQSNNLDSYRSVINQLLDQKLAYPCICTRKVLKGSSIYSGSCRNTQLEQNQPHALRIKAENKTLSFEDELQGHFHHPLAQQSGDFIIQRKDKIIAYQLAVVIDDYLQGITHVVRGFDLLDSTPKQIYLQQLLGYTTPKYCHAPIITDLSGCKLSKQAFAQAVPRETPQNTLFLLLELLKQNPPKALKTASIRDILDWGISHWQTHPLKKISAIKDNFSYGY